jgi:hypothetical protein
VNTLKPTELYTFKGWTLWYVNYISIKIITSFQKAECVNIKEDILEETLDKLKTVLGRHGEFQP